MSFMNTIVFSTGSNIGDRSSHLDFAIEEIINKIGKVISVSNVYESEAWGNIDQQNFLNQVIVVETKLTAFKCLEVLQVIEKERFRQRIEHWGPRTLDIDILFYNQEIINSHKLIIPHPFIEKRLFVLLPLSEILGTFIHPILKVDIYHILTNCKDGSEVELYNNGL